MVTSATTKKPLHAIAINKKSDRQNHFRIQRQKNDHGFYVYVLENLAENKRIFIPRFVFGQFRACIQHIIHEEQSKPKAEPFERQVSFLNRDYFYFKSSRMDLNNLIIQDVEERKGSSGYITVGRKALHSLTTLLYSDALQHPNDVLDGIISYHKLFQFSFVKGSKSITSDLILRKDVLQSTHDYRPTLAARNSSDSQPKEEKKPVQAALANSASGKKKKIDAATYQPKLGERFHEKDIKVDYGEIFGDKKLSLSSGAPAEETKDSKKSKSALSQFPTPLSATEIKAFGEGKFSFELSPDDAVEFRNRFISDRSADFYLGFEIVDTLFTYNKSLKTFQFPLYYLKVRIRESGRGVRLEARDDGKFYLNHLALAQLVEKFSEASAGVDPIENFFDNLLAQFISVDQLNDRITLIRHLPVSENIFDRTREILFGYKNENGKGGILGEMKFKGVECDLHNVILYRAPKILSPTEQSLEYDLDNIQQIAHHKVKRFYSSLLGQFLTPELQHQDQKPQEKLPVWVPGRLPKSARNLFDKMHHHDIVLLEGPPGTGKTHTILNLLIDAVCNKKRVLIVSDQQAAIEALVEKIQSYLTGKFTNAASSRNLNELLFGAIKVVNDLPTGDSQLSEVVDDLCKNFKVSEQDVSAPRTRLDKKIKQIDTQIQQHTDKITSKMQAHMAEDTPLELCEPLKADYQPQLTTENIAKLCDFLKLAFGDTAYQQRIDAFIQHRQQLIHHQMEACYGFFKLPIKEIDLNIQNLINDAALLKVISGSAITSIEHYHQVIKDAPHHELFRYLEEVLTEQLQTAGNGIKDGLKRVKQSLLPKSKSTFQKQVALLSNMVDEQIALLQLHSRWPDSAWQVLQEIHECIRLHDKPLLAFTIYNRIRHTSVKTSIHSNIQAELEKLADLVEQRDKLVYESFINQLLEITEQATTAKRGGGTNAITRIMALAESLKQFESIEESGEVFDEFRHALFDAFPIWIARKQTIALMLPCIEQSFDLVVIDEATQCRVDDALSLMFRAKKILVVGDDKQTVLQKDSTIDDYLFKDHELDEHLRTTQARGFKGGGSHIFGLIKSIKQASVMLDEHYRCPSDIIAYSNKYVYDDELKVMQWNLPEQESAVVVNYSEKDISPTKKPSSGKFKGIETAMIDRYLEFVGKTLKKIEKSTGKKINVEQDVALCYFLLKNEPYVKQAKAKFLSDLNRGEDILDGAGAALQGKERDYIFYLWDVTRYNLSAFTQGDDETKRKGELNVLMSRPKKKAYHFLHNSFEQLEHSRSNITQYLWRAYLDQQQKQNVKNPDAQLDNSLFNQLLHFTLQNSSQRGLQNLRHRVADQQLDFRRGIVVGDARREVDLLVFPKHQLNHSVGIVDLSAFSARENIGEDIADYYFQLKRAVPNIDPVFLFSYELLHESGMTLRTLVDKLEHMGNP
ncbi:hypothetical protein TDB9533_02606 [Thalassocella blandensis]|nr:hypothetical protein TDB9533_02606 [Thalassocella blandensis]